MKEKKCFRKAFRMNAFALIDFPAKISNVKISRIEFGCKMGCAHCFPDGYETVNSTMSKNTRNWKNHRKTQWRERKKK